MADLRQISAETGIPIAVLIRRGVDLVIVQYLRKKQSEWGFEQLKVVGSTERLPKYKIKPRQPK
jgi:hypothetical protein